MQAYITKIKTKLCLPFSTKRIVILGMLLALLITFKYLLGFIPGLELITFFFIFFGIFLPIIDLFLLIVSFNLLVLVMYGFGIWWLVYWIIWPMAAFVSKGLSKITHNHLVFSFWGFCAGTLVFVWYYLNDLWFYGTSYAFLNLITALPINLIEGFSTMLVFMFLAPPLSKIFQNQKAMFWPEMKVWNFKTIKNQRYQIVIMCLITLIAISAIILLIVYNQVFIDWKAMELRKALNQGLLGDGSIGNFEPIE